MTGASEAQAREFAEAFRSFLTWVHVERAVAIRRNEVVEVVQDFLGDTGIQHSVISRPFSAFEHVNLQTALNAWFAEPGRSVVVHGITLPPHHGSVNLQQLVIGESIPPLRLSAPSLIG